jgi:hypothetical protein
MNKVGYPVLKILTSVEPGIRKVGYLTSLDAGYHQFFISTNDFLTVFLRSGFFIFYMRLRCTELSKNDAFKQD